MIDILYLAKGRPEFTAESLKSLLANTEWNDARLVVYTDGDQFGDLLPVSIHRASVVHVNTSKYGGPVAIMSHFLSWPGTEIFAKIDNDVILPPGWLDQCLQVMEANPELDLLGIEPPASRTHAPWNVGLKVEAPENRIAGNNAGYARCDAIGGIGLMRRRAFAGRCPMQPHGPNGVGGFTDWQFRHADVCKGWIVPPLKLFLLDRLPMEPWASLSRKYIAEGIQRPWTNYALESAPQLWDWWVKQQSSGDLPADHRSQG